MVTRRMYSLAVMLLTALAAQGVEGLYDLLGVPHPVVAALATTGGVYGAVGAAGPVARWRRRRRWASEDEVEEWVVHQLLGGRLTNPSVAARHAHCPGGTKIIGGRAGGSRNDHDGSTRETSRSCESDEV